MSAVLVMPPAFHQAPAIEPPAPMPLDQLSARMARLLAYWHCRRGDKEMAARADIDPLDMAFALGALVLFDVEGEGQYRYRVYGSDFVDRLRRELTGLSLDSHPEKSQIPLMRRSLNEAVAARRPIARRGAKLVQGEVRRYAGLFLPLSADQCRVDQILMMVELRA